MRRLYSQRQTRQAQRALQKAREEGLIDPLYLYPEVLNWEVPEPDPLSVLMLSREPVPPKRSDTIVDQLDEPARDTRAQLYQDVSWFVDGPLAVDTFYEVARFVTTGNQTGFVKLCWTFARVSDGVGEEVELDPRDPFAIQNALGIGDSDLAWFARLHQGPFQKTIPAPFAGAQIGGYGFGPLHQWSDYRFQWGRTQSSVFWLVPQYHALRVYFKINSDQPNLLQIGGRLKGYTQPIDVRPTGWNVTHGYD